DSTRATRFLQGFLAGPANSLRSTISLAHAPARTIDLLQPPVGRRDLKATMAKNCNGERAPTPQRRQLPPPAPSRERAVASNPYEDVQAGASRATGFSTIGKLITADNRPSRIESHQTAS